MPYRDTDFSKLVNSCPVKRAFDLHVIYDCSTDCSDKTTDIHL